MEEEEEMREEKELLGEMRWLSEALRREEGVADRVDREREELSHEGRFIPFFKVEK